MAEIKRGVLESQKLKVLYRLLRHRYYFFQISNEKNYDNLTDFLERVFLSVKM